MLHGDNWPIDQADHLLGDSFDPSLEHGELRRDSVNDGVGCGHVVEIGLMEHEGIMVKPEKMACVCSFLNG